MLTLFGLRSPFLTEHDLAHAKRELVAARAERARLHEQRVRVAAEARASEERTTPLGVSMGQFDEQFFAVRTWGTRGVKQRLIYFE